MKTIAIYDEFSEGQDEEKRKLADLYDFKRPTKEQKKKFGLQNDKFIYTVKGQ